jgi:hypothetical protein
MDKSSKKLLSEFKPKGYKHGGYHSLLDEFMEVGGKSYGVLSTQTGFNKYSPIKPPTRKSIFDSTEYFGKRVKLSEGGEATVYNNPGNIESGQGFAGETGDTYAKDRKNNKKPFVVFDSPEMGVRALAMDLQTKIKRHDGDVNKIIEQYAPDNENDTKKYQEFVKKQVGKDKVTTADLKSFVEAIIKKENKPETASYYLDNTEAVDKGIALSYFQLPSNKSFKDVEALFASPREKEKNIPLPPRAKPRDKKSRSYRYRNRPTTVFDEDLTNPEEGPRNYRMPFRMGGAAPGRGTSVGRGGLGPGGNKGGNKGDRRGVTSMRDSGMVQGSTGYGPAGAGGQALGPSGNQGGNQGNQQNTTEDTTTTFNSPSFSPTYDYTPLKEDSLLDDVVDTFTDITTFNTPLGELSITPKSLTSFEAKLSFKKGGLLDRSSKK